MKIRAVLYVPSDTPEATVAATKRIAGVPLILRGMMTLFQAGITDIGLLLKAAQRPKIERFLARYPRHLLPRIEIFTSDEPYRMSPELIAQLLKAIDQHCYFLNANLLFDKELVQAMMMATSVHGREILSCQNGVHPLPFIELTRQAWEALLPFTAERPRSVESFLQELNRSQQRRIVQKSAKIQTFLVTGPRDRVIAEKFLLEGIRLATTGPVARFLNKRFSLPASLILSKLWVSPNTITILNMFIGIFAGVFVADGHQGSVILFGAALYQLASIIDGCDGEVAKLTFRGSRFGQIMDTIGDNLSLASIMIGMMGGYWRQSHSPVAFWVGGTMLVAAVTTLVVMLQMMKSRTDSKSLVAYEQEYLTRLPADRYRVLLWFMGWAKYAVKKDGFSLAVFLFALAGHLYWWLFLSAGGAAIAALSVSFLALAERQRLIREPETLSSRIAMRSKT